MDDSLPSSFDVIVVGTGLAEAMLAAAAARSGCTVLHLDECAYYGGEWASFNLRSIDEWTERERKKERGEDEAPPAPDASLVREGESLTRIRRRPTIRVTRDEWTTASSAPSTRAADAADAAGAADGEDVPAPPPVPTWREDAEEHWRRFSIDISPKVLLSRGDLVRTLCDSEVSAYAEFKLVDRLLGVAPSRTEEGGTPIDTTVDVHRIPCSRGDIFDSTALSMLDKNRLMKLLKLCMQWHAAPDQCVKIRASASTPFAAFLAAEKITGGLAQLLTRSLSFLSPAGESPTTEEAIGGLCKFMDSVGVFGASPFLVPLYGSGELPQCFARLCAVFGGTYCLGRPVEGIVESEGSVRAVLVAGQRIECAHLLMTSAYAPMEWMNEESSTTVSRAVLVANGSVREEEKESISLLNLGGLAPAAGARLLEVGWEACTAPRGYYVAQITAHGDASGLVDDVIATMYRKEEGEGADQGEKPKKPVVLRRIEWRQIEYASGADVPSNVGLLRLPDATADYGTVMEEAKTLFARFWPDRDFLPRALKKEQEDGEPFDARDDEGEVKDEKKEEGVKEESTVAE